MKEEILANIDNPKALEKLFRGNKTIFKREFNLLYPEVTNKKLAEYWHERLNFESHEISWASSNDLTFVIIASAVAGTIAKLPGAIGVKEEFFYTRNIGFIFFPLLMIYFGFKNKISLKNIFICALATLSALVFINLLPDIQKSDTVILSCLHLPFFLWIILGFTFVGNQHFDKQKRLDFLRYNGDLIVITTLILLSGMLLTAITINLFSIIEINIKEFYVQYIVVYGLSASPIVGTYITQTNPKLINKVSPLIAKIFSPIVLITLVFYLIAFIFSGKNPYNNRDYLLIFNALLIGVMLLILFSIAETSRTTKGTIGAMILFLLSLLTVIVNSIALSAILFRISEWGITPNRLAVLGGNILILSHLLIVSYRLFKTIKQADKIEVVEKSIASFLPIYGIWAVIVTFIFPFIFSFK